MGFPFQFGSIKYHLYFYIIIKKAIELNASLPYVLIPENQKKFHTAWQKINDIL